MLKWEGYGSNAIV